MQKHNFGHCLVLLPYPMPSMQPPVVARPVPEGDIAHGTAHPKGTSIRLSPQSRRPGRAVKFSLKARRPGAAYRSPDQSPDPTTPSSAGASPTTKWHVTSPRPTIYRGAFSSPSERLLRAAQSYSITPKATEGGEEEADSPMPMPSLYPGVRPSRARQQAVAADSLAPERMRLAMQCAAGVSQEVVTAYAGAAARQAVLAGILPASLQQQCGMTRPLTPGTAGMLTSQPPKPDVAWSAGSSSGWGSSYVHKPAVQGENTLAPPFPGELWRSRRWPRARAVGAAGPWHRRSLSKAVTDTVLINESQRLPFVVMVLK